MTSRRYFPALMLAILQIVGTAHAIASPLPAEKYLERLTYGQTPEAAKSIQSLGLESWLDQQLHPGDVPWPATWGDKPEFLARDPAGLYISYGAPYQLSTDKNVKNTLHKEWRRLFDEQRSYRLLRAVYSPFQLQELLTEFWFNHFNVYAPKSDIMLWLPDYENRILRSNALGNFENLLIHVVKHPAMLIYLDNTANQKDRPDKKGINENLAREILELHTLGVHGGYTQADVINLARILSGWSVNRNGITRGENTITIFQANRHDTAPKTLLGHTLISHGQDELDEALHILALHPATATHICTKLAKFFVSDTPSDSLVAKMSSDYLQSSGDISLVLRNLFLSEDFRAEVEKKSLFKTPYHFAISTVRTGNIQPLPVRPILGLLNNSSQPLYMWTTPDGYPFSRQDWLTPDNLIKRIDFAISLFRMDPESPGTSNDSAQLIKLAGPENQRK